MTISGAKKILDLKINKLDENNSIGLKAGYLKLKSRIILKKLNNLKKYGKKTHIKVRMVRRALLIVSLFTMQKNRLRGKKLKKN